MEKSALIRLLNAFETVVLAHEVLSDTDKNLPMLMEAALVGPPRLRWRAAFVSDMVERHTPGLLMPWIDDITRKLAHEEHAGCRRQYLKTISLYPIHPEKQGFLADYCLERLDKKEPPAVKAHAMQILYNLSQVEPALKPELLEVFTFLLEQNESAGISARARNLARKLSGELHRRPTELD